LDARAIGLTQREPVARPERTALLYPSKAASARLSYTSNAHKNFLDCVPRKAESELRSRKKDESQRVGTM
jgi:hypothetical protein